MTEYKLIISLADDGRADVFEVSRACDAAMNPLESDIIDGGAGYGFGQRDMDWTFATADAAARAYAFALPIITAAGYGADDIRIAEVEPTPDTD